MKKLVFLVICFYVFDLAFGKKLKKLGKKGTKVTTASVTSQFTTDKSAVFTTGAEMTTLLEESQITEGFISLTNITEFVNGTLLSTTLSSEVLPVKNGSDLLILSYIHELGLTCVENNLFNALKDNSTLRFLSMKENGLEVNVNKELEMISAASCVAFLFPMTHLQEPVLIANYIEKVFADSFFENGYSFGNKCIILVVLTYKSPHFFSGRPKLAKLLYKYQLMFDMMGLNYHGILFMHLATVHQTEKVENEFCIPRANAFANFVLGTMRNLSRS